MNKRDGSVGDLLRSWRQRRRLSQLVLSTEAEISQRHLSFIESGRSIPSRDMISRLANRLCIPHRERNALLVGAGFAPVYAERRLDDPELDAARLVVERILKGHEPYPALAVDRHWTLLHANRAIGGLLEGVDQELLTPPVNVLRLSLHPGGLAPRIANFREWRAHILERLMRQIDSSADPVLTEMLQEFKRYPVPSGARSYQRSAAPSLADIAVPLQLDTENGTLSFLSTTTVFGTPIDISLSELAIESFFPADEATAATLSDLAAARQPS